MNKPTLRAENIRQARKIVKMVLDEFLLTTTPEIKELFAKDVAQELAQVEAKAREEEREQVLQDFSEYCHSRYDGFVKEDNK